MELFTEVKLFTIFEIPKISCNKSDLTSVFVLPKLLVTFTTEITEVKRVVILDTNCRETLQLMDRIFIHPSEKYTPFRILSVSKIIPRKVNKIINFRGYNIENSMLRTFSKFLEKVKASFSYGC